MELIMLGTGNAAVTKCYNTCFALRKEDEYLLVDAGGGNGILVQLEKAGIAVNKIHDVFVTHAHTDHLLGIIWIIRMVAQLKQKEQYEGTLRIYGHDKVIEVIEWCCRMTLPKKIAAFLGNGIELCEVKDNDRFEMMNLQAQCFDIGSTKEKQFGVAVTLADGKRLVCLGDEPYNEINRAYVENCDWLLSEAFCLYADRDIFKPYEKHHSTALDAGKMAADLHVGNLLMFHTEDKTLSSRKEKYTAEAAQYFTGNVFVPDDLEVIRL